MPVELDEIVVADESETWRAGGFTVDDDGVVAAGTVRVRLVGRDAGKRIVGWSLRGVPDGTDAVDGLPTSPSTAAAPPGVTHANGVTSLDHIVVVSPHLERTVTALVDLGIEPKRRRDVGAEQYGFDAQQVFFRLGEPILELIGARDAEGEGPAAFFGLAWTVDDIDALPGLFGSSLGRVKDAVQPGRRITTLRHKELGMSVATAFMSPEPPA